MLISLKIKLSSQSSKTLREFFGREVHAWFLGQIARYNTSLANYIHCSEGIPPYTVSSIFKTSDVVEKTENQNNRYWIRITTLTEQLGELLLTKFVPGLPTAVKLRSDEFTIEGWTTEGDWAGQTSFDEIVKRANEQFFPSQIKLKFASPTAFRIGYKEIILPSPDCTWISLFRKWNSLAPDISQIDPVWSDFAQNCIGVSKYNIHSETISLFRERHIKGCVGDVTYILLPEEECGEYSSYRRNADLVIKLLADFSMYSGVGSRTTFGFGQTVCTG